MLGSRCEAEYVPSRVLQMGKVGDEQISFPSIRESITEDKAFHTSPWLTRCSFLVSVVWANPMLWAVDDKLDSVHSI